jgi:hypothetical protein
MQQLAAQKLLCRLAMGACVPRGVQTKQSESSRAVTAAGSSPTHRIHTHRIHTHRIAHAHACSAQPRLAHASRARCKLRFVTGRSFQRATGRQGKARQWLRPSPSEARRSAAKPLLANLICAQIMQHTRLVTYRLGSQGQARSRRIPCSAHGMQRCEVRQRVHPLRNHLLHELGVAEPVSAVQERADLPRRADRRSHSGRVSPQVSAIRVMGHSVFR